MKDLADTAAQGQLLLPEIPYALYRRARSTNGHGQRVMQRAVGLESLRTTGLHPELANLVIRPKGIAMEG